MVILYIVKTSSISKEIAEELAQFGSVGLISKIMKLYSLEMNPEFLPSVKGLSFVEDIEEDTKGYLSGIKR